MSPALDIATRTGVLLLVASANAVAVALVVGLASGSGRPLRTLADLGRLMRKDDREVSSSDRLALAAVPALVLVASFVALAPLSFARYLAFGVPGAGVVATIAALALAPAATVLVAGSAAGAQDRHEAMRSAVSRFVWIVPLALSTLTPVMIAGGLEPSALVEAQRGTWLSGLLPRWFALSPHVPAFALFAISAYLFAAPLLDSDGSAAPGEAAFAGARLALLRLASHTIVFAVCALAVTVFFGGWLVPYVDRMPAAEALGPLVFVLKTYALVYVLARVRDVLPRIASARPVTFAWTRLVPASLAWVVLYAAVTRGGGL